MKAEEIDVIAPNLKRRLSGVTATIVRLAPLQAKMIGLVTTGPGLPPGLPHIPLWRCALLPRRKLRVWHARRNSEMLAGLVLRGLFRRRLKLVFTSASQRRHTPYTKWLIGRMDALVATSARTASYLQHPSEVILHGIDLSGFSPEEHRDVLRRELGLPSGTLIACYGRIRAQKGTDVFVDAMISVLPRRPGTYALVMGRATAAHEDFLQELKAKVAAAGLERRILFLPEVTADRMADWYRVLDLYVAPQRWEGFGLTPIEAMACGVPVVATTVGAFDEMLTEETGTLVPPGDVAALAAAVAGWLDAPVAREAAGRAARARAENAFALEREAGALVALYRRLLASG